MLNLTFLACSTLNRTVTPQVPMLLRNVLPRLSDFLRRLLNRAPKAKSTVVRTIEYVQKSTYTWWESSSDPSNQLLQKALLNYVNTYTDALTALPDAALQLKKRPLAKKASAAEDDDDGEAAVRGADGNDAASSDDGEGDGTAGNEHDYDVNVAPPEGIWITFAKKNVRFMR